MDNQTQHHHRQQQEDVRDNSDTQDRLRLQVLLSSATLHSEDIPTTQSVSSDSETDADDEEHCVIESTVSTHIASDQIQQPQSSSIEQDKSSHLYIVHFPLRLIYLSIWTIMNAAMTIFGFGIGVGLILGDTMRPSTAVNVDHSIPTRNATTAARHQQQSQQPVMPSPSSTVVLLRPATPSCRALVQHRYPVQEDHQQSASSTHSPQWASVEMPAQ